MAPGPWTSYDALRPVRGTGVRQSVAAAAAMAEAKVETSE